MNERKAGILLSYLNIGINSLVMLLYVPMLLHYVSKEQYGVYQMIGSFISIIAVLDFGLCATVTRFVAREKSLQHPQQEQNILNTAAGLYLLITGFLLLVGAGMYFLIGPVYGATLSAQDLVTAQQIFLILLLNLAVCLPGNLFVALLQASERFVFFQLLWLVGNILTPLFIWGVLSWKASVVAVVWVQTIGNILMVLGRYIYCKKRLNFRFGFSWHDKPLMKQLVGFSFFVFVGHIANQLSFRLGPLVLGMLAGALAVANYYIASQLLISFMMIPSLIGSVFLPKLSGDYATTVSLQSHNDIFCKTGRLQLMVALLIWTGFALLGKPFLYLWLGPGNEECYRLALVIMTGALVNITQSVGPSVLMAIDKYRFYACVTLAMALLNVGLSFPLVKLYGTMGCAISFVISIGLLNGIVVNRYYQQVGLKIADFFRAVWPVAYAGGIVLVGLAGVWHFWPVRQTWFSFVLHGACVVAVYGVFMRLVVFNQFEKDILQEVFSKARQVLGK